MRGHLALADLRADSRNGIADDEINIENPIMCMSPKDGKGFHHH